EEAALKGAQILPQDANWHYNVACVYARRQRLDDAIIWLEKAVDLGFGNSQHVLADEDLKILHSHVGFQNILKKLNDPKRQFKQNPTLKQAFPEPINKQNSAIISAKNTQWEWHPVNGGYFTTFFLPPPAQKASDYTLLYVNRDEDSTQPDISSYPSIISAIYDDEAVSSYAHISVANGLFMMGNQPLPTIGNTVSVIQKLPFWRTIPRLIATTPTIMANSYRFAFMNQLYFYDATIDVSKNFKGDILPFIQPFYFNTADFGNANTSKDNPLNPSKAQQTLVEYAFATVDAMPAETRQKMFEQNLFVWTMQRLFRESQVNAKDIFDPLAHPAAFDPQFIDKEKLLAKARALTPETLPPMFRIMMLEEKQPTQYVDYFDPSEREFFGDTSMSIGRVVRDLAYTRKMTIIANGEANLTYRWFTVNGQADKIRITPLTDTGSKTKIEVDWHGVYTHPQGYPIRRVDIACVAVRPNGTTSAPAFLSLRYLANEQRTYEKGRLISVDYRAPKTGLIFEDPALTTQKHWQDDYHYNAKGECIGWTRTSDDKPLAQFNAKGERLITPVAGQPATAQKPLYTPRMNAQSDGISSPALELLEF
ncbi:MAG: tetratricopeptide repeat protein, partial [bacterium]|nr:tetratricopeptide repeat protein [bacterium]